MNDNVQNTLLGMVAKGRKAAEVWDDFSNRVVVALEQVANGIEQAVEQAREDEVEDEKARAEAKRRHPAGKGSSSQPTESAVGREEMLSYLKANSNHNSIWKTDAVNTFGTLFIKECYKSAIRENEADPDFD
jgi:hypothetical protein